MEAVADTRFDGILPRLYHRIRRWRTVVEYEQGSQGNVNVHSSVARPSKVFRSKIEFGTIDWWAMTGGHSSQI